MPNDSRGARTHPTCPHLGKRPILANRDRRNDQCAPRRARRATPGPGDRSTPCSAARRGRSSAPRRPQLPTPPDPAAEVVVTLTNMLGFEPDTRTDRAPRAWPKFMTARVAADYSDSSPWTIRRHVRPCGRRGRVFVYSIESVEEWMRGQTVMSRRSDAPLKKPHRPRPKAAKRGRSRDLAKARDRAPVVVENRNDNVAA